MAAHLGVFIQPSSCSLRSATLSRVRDTLRACFSIVAKWRAYSVGRPHVAGSDPAHFGWHTMLHSARTTESSNIARYHVRV